MSASSAAIIACEAVGQGASVAALGADGALLVEHHIAPRRYAQELVPRLHETLEQFGRPKALALACGPGSFTGLRVSVLAMRTLAYTDQLAVHAVDSLLALAYAAGPGKHWVWLPLKRDTTFHAVFQVSHDGHCETLHPVQACLDSQPPQLPAQLVQGATVIGPALREKPQLHAQWAPALPTGSSAALSAQMVARAAQVVPAVPWQQVLPAYHQASAPELQRAAQLQQNPESA